MSNESNPMGGTINPTGGTNFWKIAAIVLAIGLVGFVIYGQTGSSMTDATGNKVSAVSTKDAGAKFESFLNEVYGESIGEVKVNEISEQDGLYKVVLSIPKNTQAPTTTVYLTRDAKLFIPSLIEIDKALADKTQSDQTSATQPPATVTKSDKPTVELFTMSYCPYGNQAEAGIIPVAKLLTKSVEIVPRYVIYANYQGGGPNYCIDKDSKYCSLHGINEIKQDVRELCIYKYNKSKYWDYISKVNTQCTLNDIETCWSTPAKELKIDTAKITKCLSSEAETLLAEEVKANEKYSVTGSPTLIINGGSYEGGRTPEDYKNGICNAFNTAPAECSQTLGSTTSAASNATANAASPVCH